MPRPTLTARLAVVATAAALSLLAGCGGSDDSGTDKKSSDGNFAELPGKEISDTAKEDMLALDSLAYAGQLVTNGESLALDVHASSDGSCTGSLELSGGKVELLAADGQAWYRPDEAFWRANAGDGADQVIDTVGDKWVVDSQGDFSQFCDLNGFLTSIFTDDGSKSTYEVVGTEDIDGQQVVKVTNTDDDGSATGYVLVEGKHYLLKIERTEGDSPGELNFAAFNEDVAADAPADDEQIDLSTQS
jgi:hypothetical protein